MAVTESILTQERPLKEPEWRALLWSIQHQKCVLVLGPYLYDLVQGDQSAPPRVLLARALAKDLPADLAPNPDDLPGVSSAFEQQFGDFVLKMTAAEFYQQLQSPPALLEMLASLPFKLIINTAPEGLLPLAYLQQGGQCHQGFYHYRSSRKTVLEYDPDDRLPFVYHLLGSAADADSLVLSQNDHLAYLRTVLQTETSLPYAISKELTPQKTYLFLGFNFESWYLKLLLYLIQSQSDTRTFLFGFHNAATESLRPDTRSFFQLQFQMKFISTPVADFIAELNERLKPAASAPTSVPSLQKRQLLYLYDPEDAPYAQALDKHLATAKADFNLTTKRLDDIPLGAAIAAGQQQLLAEADIIIALLSADFFYSESLINLLNQASQQHGRDKLLVPVLIRPASWQDTDIANLPTFLPRNETPVSKWNDRDEAWQHIVSEITQILKARTHE